MNTSPPEKLGKEHIRSELRTELTLTTVLVLAIVISRVFNPSKHEFGSSGFWISTSLSLLSIGALVAFVFIQGKRFLRSKGLRLKEYFLTTSIWGKLLLVVTALFMLFGLLIVLLMLFPELLGVFL